VSPDAVCRILVSYWYYKKRDLGDFGRQTRLPVRLFADSGAFTAYTMRAKGGQIRREDYAAWLREWQPLLSVAINLDVIGDHRASMRNQLWLEGQGLNVIPVYHMQSPLSELRALCRDYRYVCIGGTAQLKGANKLAASARALLVAREHGTAVHGLGRSASDELAALPFYSVDATSWVPGRPVRGAGGVHRGPGEVPARPAGCAAASAAAGARRQPAADAPRGLREQGHKVGA
jgi:hypothetical protein